MEDDHTTPFTRGFVLPLFMFIAASLGLAVDLPTLLGNDSDFSLIGKYVLPGIMIFAVGMFLYRLYRSLVSKCVLNALIVRNTRRRLQQFIEANQGNRLTTEVDAHSVYLLQQWRKISDSRFPIVKVNLLDPVPGDARQRVQLIVKRGRTHGLVAGMEFMIRRTVEIEALCKVRLEDVVRTTPDDSYCILTTTQMSIFLYADPTWNLNTNEIAPDSFEVRPVKPNLGSPVNELLSDLACEIDRTLAVRIPGRRN